MATISNERIEFNPQRDILGKTMGAGCLCPAWMCWMPLLVDGVEVMWVQEKTRERKMSGHRHQAGLKGL
jgi:hypothetical protein